MVQSPRWAPWLSAAAVPAALAAGLAAPSLWWPLVAIAVVLATVASLHVVSLHRILREQAVRLRQQFAIRDATHDMVLVMDHEGRLLECNQQARRHLPGYLGHEVQVGAPLRAPLQALLGDAWQELQDGVMRSGSGQCEDAFDTQTGRRAFRMTLVRESEGCILVITDVTVQHEAWEAEREREREAARMENLESLHRLQRDFINTASHELQTPLTPLRLQARILRARAGSYLKEKDLHAIEVIERNTERMARLVEDVLEVVRLENGRLPITIEPMDLGHVVQSTVTDHLGVAMEKGVDMEFHGPEELMGCGDAFRIGQVVGNLLNNAIKFSDAGDVVRVGLSAHDGLVTITVRDEGAGMDPDEVQGLFQPFHQFHQDVRPGHGTGLGLAICQGIMDAMGGHISAHSDGRGLGAVFTLQLPLNLEMPPTASHGVLAASVPA